MILTGLPRRSRVAHLQLKEMAVPDMTISWTMPASAPGEYELRGNQMCGYLHLQLMGSIIVQSRRGSPDGCRNRKRHQTDQPAERAAIPVDFTRSMLGAN